MYLRNDCPAPIDFRVAAEHQRNLAESADARRIQKHCAGEWTLAAKLIGREIAQAVAFERSRYRREIAGEMMVQLHGEIIDMREPLGLIEKTALAPLNVHLDEPETRDALLISDASDRNEAFGLATIRRRTSDRSAVTNDAARVTAVGFQQQTHHRIVLGQGLHTYDPVRIERE